MIKKCKEYIQGKLCYLVIAEGLCFKDECRLFRRLKLTKLTMDNFKEWVNIAKDKRPTLSVFDLYRFLTNKEPFSKNENIPFGFKKHFRVWLKIIWIPFYKGHYDELGLFLWNFQCADYFGFMRYFKVKEANISGYTDKAK